MRFKLFLVEKNQKKGHWIQNFLCKTPGPKFYMQCNYYMTKDSFNQNLNIWQHQMKKFAAKGEKEKTKKPTFI